MCAFVADIPETCPVLSVVTNLGLSVLLVIGLFILIVLSLPTNVNGMRLLHVFSLLDFHTLGCYAILSVM